MRNIVKNFFVCIYMALEDMVNHDGIEHAGYLAFLGLLSLFPFLVFFMALAESINSFCMTHHIVLSNNAHLIGVNITDWILKNIPSDFVSALRPRIQEIVWGPPQNILTLAILGAIWTSSSAVEGLRTILNRAYRVESPPPYIQRRLLSILQFLLLTFTVILASIVLIIIPLLWNKMTHILGLPMLNYSNYAFLRYGLLAGIIWYVISVMYYVLPQKKQQFYPNMVGAGIVMLLWSTAGKIFYIYLAHFNQMNIIYGSLAGIIISIMFFYIVSMIFIFGAELNFHLQNFTNNTKSKG